MQELLLPTDLEDDFLSSEIENNTKRKSSVDAYVKDEKRHFFLRLKWTGNNLRYSPPKLPF